MNQAKDSGKRTSFFGTADIVAPDFNPVFDNRKHQKKVP
jgi:hypothetical protein